MNAQGYSYDAITSGVFSRDLQRSFETYPLVGVERGLGYALPNELLPRITGVTVEP